MISSIIFASVCFGTVLSQSAPHFADGILVGKLSNPDINHASGLAASRVHPGVLYTHNDGADVARIFAINATSGETISTININGATNHDWEDMSVGPCGVSICIYIGDIGDRHGSTASTIYRVIEPAEIQTRSMVLDVESILSFKWDEPDSQTLMVDPEGEVYLVSTERGKAKFTQLPASAWGTGIQTEVTSYIEMPVPSYIKEPRGGDISPNGQEIIMQYHYIIYYWSVQNKDYFAAMKEQPAQVAYHLEHTSEAVAWDSTGSGYYSLNEHTNAPLYYYSRL